MALPVFNAVMHDREVPTFPSRFAFRVVLSTGIICYFVIREGRRLGLKLAEITTWMLAGSTLYLAVAYGFRQTTGELPGIAYASLAAFGTWLLVWLMTQAIIWRRARTK